MLLKELCDKRGVSGDEGEIRAFIKEKAAPLCDDILTDALGNLICHKKGDGPRVLVCAHMDEVGLMIRGIDESGLIRFASVGGVDPRVLVSKRVHVGEKRVPGVIGAKAIHLQTPAEYTTALTIDNLYVDIGCDSKAEVEGKCELGDTISFDSDFVEFGEGLIKGKALDDRAGCLILLKLLEGTYPCDLYVVFTAQEEVGTRGAMVAAHRVKPDFALVLEATAVNDVTEDDAHYWVAELGKGAAITYKDMGVIVAPKLRDAIIETARENDIPWQPKGMHTGGNDAAAIHTAAGGAPSAVLSVPTRYIHSQSNVLKASDIDKTFDLVDAFLRRDNTALCGILKGEKYDA